MKKTSNKFIQGTLILSIAGILAKIISVFYKIPLTNLVDVSGVGLYQMVYPIYLLLTAASLVGIPNSISKLVASEIALGQYRKAHQTFKEALLITFLLGACISLFLFFGADALIAFGKWNDEMQYPNEEMRFLVRGLSLSPMFIAITGAIRGYYQGMGIMKPSAIAQVIENIVKVIAGISLVKLFIAYEFGLAMRVSGATMGVTLGAFMASVYMVATYIKQRKVLFIKIDADKHQLEKEAVLPVVKRIYGLAIPVTIVSAAYSIMSAIDSLTMFRALKRIGYNEEFARLAIGKISVVYSVINVPLTIGVAIAASIVPTIAAIAINESKQAVNKKINQAIKFSLLVALPASAGLFVLGKPILQLIYRGNAAGFTFIAYYSVCLVFMILGQTLAGLLQGLSRHDIPLKSLGIAAIIKIVLNFLLIASYLEGRGAAIASIIYYIVFVIINFHYLKKLQGLVIEPISMFIKPFIAACIMGITVYLSYPLVMRIFENSGSSMNFYNINTLATLFVIILGGCVYGGALLFVKALDKEDLAVLPKGAWLIKIFEKYKLLS